MTLNYEILFKRKLQLGAFVNLASSSWEEFPFEFTLIVLIQMRKSARLRDRWDVRKGASKDKRAEPEEIAFPRINLCRELLRRGSGSVEFFNIGRYVPTSCLSSLR